MNCKNALPWIKPNFHRAFQLGQQFSAVQQVLCFSSACKVDSSRPDMMMEYREKRLKVESEREIRLVIGLDYVSKPDEVIMDTRSVPPQSRAK
jgi:hypothetical protein